MPIKGNRPIFIKTYNCVGAWNFEGDYTDSSGRGNNATLVGAGSIADGVYGNCVSLGDTGYFNITNNATVQFTTQAYTGGGWVQTEGYPIADSCILGKWNANQGYIIAYFGDTNPGDIGMYTNTTNFHIVNVYPNDNQWHHVMCGKSGTTGYVWFDGEMVGSGVLLATVSDRNTPLEIGTYGNGGGGKIWSALDEVRLYNRLLTTTEVQNLMYGYEPAPVSIDMRNMTGLRNFYWEGGNDNASMEQSRLY